MTRRPPATSNTNTSLTEARKQRGRHQDEGAVQALAQGDGHTGPPRIRAARLTGASTRGGRSQEDRNDDTVSNLHAIEV